jgi:hypothetical protein
MNDRTYVVIPAATVASIEFDEVHESSEFTLKWSVDETQTFVKFTGDTPDFLEGMTSHTHAEIHALMRTSAWSDPDGGIS